MTEEAAALARFVTPADLLARIAHDPQHVCQRQLAGCGCFLPHLLVCTAGRSLGTASARPFSTVSVHRVVRLSDVNGRYSDDWTESPMRAGMGPDGCPMFRGYVALDLAHAGKTFKWGVVLDGPQGANFWGFRPKCRM